MVTAFRGQKPYKFTTSTQPSSLSAIMISKTHIPYSGKFSLVQIFAEKRPDSSEEIFAVFIFAERGTLWPHPYRLMWHLRSVSYGFVGILYSRRLILLYSNHLEGRHTVENHLIHISTRTHVMTSSISILVHFFAVFIFAEAGVSTKNPAKISRYTVSAQKPCGRQLNAKCAQ